MKLRHDSFLLRFAYFGDTNWRVRTDLCSLFWRLVFVTIIWAFLLTAAGFLVAVVAVELYLDPVQTLLNIALSMAAVVLLVLGIAYSLDVGPRLGWTEWVKFLKGRYCPTIEIE